MSPLGTFKRKDTFQVSINTVPYDVVSWETISTGRVLERRYDKGFIGGVGPFSEDVQSRPDQLHQAINLDTSTFPYIRLTPRHNSKNATSGDAGAPATDGSAPTYWFAEQDSANTIYIYMVNGRQAKKFSLDIGALHSSYDFGSLARVGRPVLFDGEWCIPLGNAQDAVRLTTISITSTADVYTDFAGANDNARGLAFGIGMDEGIAQIWKAGEDNSIRQNEVSISASASSASFGDGHDVGDATMPITDMMVVGGRMVICKADAPWYFSIDGGGNAYQITELLDQAGDISSSNQYIGANSNAHGPYGYYVHPSGIWRILGDNAVPVDLFSDPTWSSLAWKASSGTVIGAVYYGTWTSVATYGRWIYATEDIGGVWHGYINNDGTVRWQGNLLNPNGTTLTAKCRVGIVNPGGGPSLLILDSAGLLFKIGLEADGSTRNAKASDRGGSSETSLAIAPGTDFDEPEKLKQVRMMWCFVDNMPSSNFTIKMGVYRDRSTTFTTVGDSITATGGKKEVTTTPGTNDTFYECHPVMEFVTGAGYLPGEEDPRIRAWGIRCVTPTIYRATIPVDSRSQKGRSHSVYDALNALRDLKNGASVTVGEIGNDDTWTGYIEDVKERTITDTLGNPQHQLVVDIGRWVY